MNASRSETDIPMWAAMQSMSSAEIWFAFIEPRRKRTRTTQTTKRNPGLHARKTMANDSPWCVVPSE
eukprot:1012286-Prymnesium_polylepis.1